MLEFGAHVQLVPLIGILRIQEMFGSHIPRPDTLEMNVLITTEVTPEVEAEPDTGMPCRLSGKSARLGLFFTFPSRWPACFVSF